MLCTAKAYSRANRSGEPPRLLVATVIPVVIHNREDHDHRYHAQPYLQIAHAILRAMRLSPSTMPAPSNIIASTNNE